MPSSYVDLLEIKKVPVAAPRVGQSRFCAVVFFGSWALAGDQIAVFQARVTVCVTRIGVSGTSRIFSGSCFA